MYHGFKHTYHIFNPHNNTKRFVLLGNTVPHLTDEDRRLRLREFKGLLRTHSQK